MSPSFPVHNRENCLVSDSIDGSEGLGAKNRATLSILNANFPNLTIAKLSAGVSLSPWRARFNGGGVKQSTGLSFLHNLVVYIVGVCSKKKVLWIYAGRIVTFMANTNPIRYFTEGHLVRKPMGVVSLAMSGEHPVSTAPCELSSRPHPAIVTLFNIAPKFINGFLVKHESNIHIQPALSI